MACRTDGHTSAIFAAITGEPDSGVYRNAIISAPLRLISAVTLLETQIVLVSRSGSHSIPILHKLIERAGIVVVPFDEPMAETAFDAFKRWQGAGTQGAAQHHLPCSERYQFTRSFIASNALVAIATSNPEFCRISGTGIETWCPLPFEYVSKSAPAGGRCRRRRCSSMVAGETISRLDHTHIAG